MDKTERIAAMKDLPDEAIFFIKRNGQFWAKGDWGYTDDFNQAKPFTNEEIVDRINRNMLNGKTVLMMKLHVIC